MKLTIHRDALLKPLQQVAAALGGRPTLPILSHVLLEVSEQQLRLTATDLEVELVAQIALDTEHEIGATTVPAKKFLDICRSLSDGATISLKLVSERLQIQSEKSRFSLSTLPAKDFPNLEDWQPQLSLDIEQGAFKKLLDATSFSMANQDVRYYLNGMLLETEGDFLRSVATDGHRLSMSQLQLPSTNESLQVIVPRKGIQEIQRLLSDSELTVRVEVGQNNVRMIGEGIQFTSKLVDGRFPDYRRVIPKNGDKIVLADRETLRQGFVRAAILSNEKFRGVRFSLSEGQVMLTANNPEREEAEEQIDVDYQDAALEMGFNVSYAIDVLNHLSAERVQITLADAASAALIEAEGDDSAQYVIMPMRL